MAFLAIRSKMFVVARKRTCIASPFSTKFALRASEMCLRHVKYAYACEIFAARKRAYFISLCGETAKYHVCRKANISYPAPAGYFTLYSRFSGKYTQCVFSHPLEGLCGSEPKRPVQGRNREIFLLIPAFFHFSEKHSTYHS